MIEEARIGVWECTKTSVFVKTVLPAGVKGAMDVGWIAGLVGRSSKSKARERRLRVAQVEVKLTQVVNTVASLDTVVVTFERGVNVEARLLVKVLSRRQSCVQGRRGS